MVKHDIIQYENTVEQDKNIHTPNSDYESHVLSLMIMNEGDTPMNFRLRIGGLPITKRLTLATGEQLNLTDMLKIMTKPATPISIVTEEVPKYSVYGLVQLIKVN